MDNIAIIKTLQGGLANILLFLLKIPNELNNKLIFLINAIKKAIDTSTLRTKLCPRLIPRFDKKCKNAQMKVKKVKKIWKKEGIEESWKAFRLA